MTTKSRLDALQRCVPRRPRQNIVVVYEAGESSPGYTPPTPEQLAVPHVVIKVVYDHAKTAPGVG